MLNCPKLRKFTYVSITVQINSLTQKIGLRGFDWIELEMFAKSLDTPNNTVRFQIYAPASHTKVAIRQGRSISQKVRSLRSQCTLKAIVIKPLVPMLLKPSRPYLLFMLWNS